MSKASSEEEGEEEEGAVEARELRGPVGGTVTLRSTSFTTTPAVICFHCIFGKSRGCFTSFLCNFQKILQIRCIWQGILCFGNSIRHDIFSRNNLPGL